MQTNPVRRLASVLLSLFVCLLFIGLFMAQLRYAGLESSFSNVAYADVSDATSSATIASSGVVTAEYCSEVVAANNPSNPSGRTSTTLSFDDSWFFNDSHTYQHGLASACAVLSAVCNSESQYHDGVEGSIPYAEQTLGLLGFKDVRTDSYALRSSILDEASSLLVGSSDVAAYTLANKSIISKKDGKPITLLFVGIRSTYGTEWLSNFNFLGQNLSDIDHRGFKTAKEEVEQALHEYSHELGADPSRTRILITGHSRGGAIANLLAADLDNPRERDTSHTALAPASGIYAYTFAAPCTTRADERHDQEFSNIFNVANEADIVTQLPLPAWGFGRYGSTIELPSTASADFSNSFSAAQAAYHRNTGYTLGHNEDALASLYSFGKKASLHVPTAEGLVSPVGIIGVIQSFMGLDLSTALDAHYPDTYIAWMQALDFTQPVAA